MLSLLLLLVQGPAVTTELDRDRAAVGEDVEFTVVVETAGEEPPTLSEPELRGLEFVTRRERRTVRFDNGAPRRVLRRTLVLRATRTGSGVIGPLTVAHGGTTVQTDSLTVTIRGTAAPTALEPHVIELLRSVRPEASDSNRVGLTLVVAPEVVALGQQTDVVLAAWFPRDVRQRIRTQPTIEAPQVRGAWVYQRPTPSGIALSRTVDGRIYDLYVVHLVAFPLTAGGVQVGVGKVSYSVPLTFSFLSREVRMEVASAPRVIDVAPLPLEGRPEGFAGAVGSAMTIEVATSGRELPMGGSARVEVRVAGTGNVALWPEPPLVWPAGLRVYPQEVDVDLDPRTDLVGGAKTFRYLVVPDSSGAHRVPAVSYPVFDFTTARYGAVRTGPLDFVTPAAMRAPVAGRDPLQARGGLGRLMRWSPPFWVFVLVWVVAPLALGLRGWKPRRGAATARAPGLTVAASPLLDDFRRAIRLRVADEAALGARALETALRAAGVEASLARHAARVRDRLLQPEFGPSDALDVDELRVEAEAVLRALGGAKRGAAVNEVAAIVVAVAVLGVPTILSAQSAEALYDAGAVRTAADSFLVRATEEPSVAAHWYNLAVAAAAAGERGTGAAALLEAARRAPRDADVRRQVNRWALTERGAGAWISPVTPTELAVAATLLWVLGWSWFGTRRRRRWAVIMLVLAAMGLAAAQYVLVRYAVPVVFVQGEGTPLRTAPFGPAPGVTVLGAGDPLVVAETQGPWMQVIRAGRTGWVLQREVAGF
jgi:hypothetical protein